MVNIYNTCHGVTISGFSGQWNWMANTLNPYYEGNSLSCMIDDDRLIVDTLDKWCFGADNTGDVTGESFLTDAKRAVEPLVPVSLVRCVRSFVLVAPSTFSFLLGNFKVISFYFFAGDCRWKH